MKAILIAFVGLLALILFPGTSNAKRGDISAGGMLGIAVAPAWGAETGFGFLTGGGYQFLEGLVPGAGDGIEGRVEIGYFSWSWRYSWFAYGWDLSSRVIPFMTTARYFYPVSDAFNVYGLGGLSLNFWSYEGVAFDIYGDRVRLRTSATVLGVVLGTGGEYYISPQFSIGGELRYNSGGWGTSLMVQANYHILSASAPAHKPAPRRRR